MKEVKNAVIRSATLSIADHGLLSSFVHLDYGGSGPGFGGFVLGKPGDSLHEQGGYAAHWICRVLQIADVMEWGELRGRSVRVSADSGKVHAIGHFLRDEWFEPSIDFQGAPES